LTIYHGDVRLYLNVVIAITQEVDVLSQLGPTQVEEIREYIVASRRRNPRLTEKQLYEGYLELHPELRGRLALPRFRYHFNTLRRRARERGVEIHELEPVDPLERAHGGQLTLGTAFDQINARWTAAKFRVERAKADLARAQEEVAQAQAEADRWKAELDLLVAEITGEATRSEDQAEART
jgi:hypothetical protein